MRAAKCPECGAKVRVSSAVEVGEEVTCETCGEELEVVDTEPLTLGYLGDYEEELEGEDLDEEWDDLDDDDDDPL